ncbi:MAG: hypothetical protein AMXMBFR64_14180 [Myxococcales bacterium]
MRIHGLRGLARVLVLPLALGLAACGESDGDHTGVDKGPGGTTEPGDHIKTPDTPSNGLLTIDEAKITATVDGKNLVVSIPALAMVASAKGTLTASIVEVDGAKVASSITVHYDIAEGQTKALEATLALPESATSQPALAAWVLRVEQKGDKPLKVTRSLLHLVPPYEVVLEGPKTLLAGKGAAYRVLANDPIGHGPLEGVPVKLTLTDEAGKATVLEGITGMTGDAIFDVTLPTPGEMEVVAEGKAQGTMAVVADTITVSEKGRKVLLTTDKPLYQPGQTIHMRALALEKPGLAPVADKPVTFEVEDGKGNKIHKVSIDSDQYGIAATELKLATLVNMGTFKVRAILDDVVTEKAVTVSHYVLPKFKLGVGLDQSWYMPAATVTGLVDADYFFGKVVAGADVKIVAQSYDVSWSTFQEVSGTTNADGHYGFTLTLPPSLVGLPLEGGDALVQLIVTVTDKAEQVVEKYVPVVVSASALKVVAVPEAGVLVPGTENLVHLFVTDPLGAPLAGASIAVEGTWLPSSTLTTDAFGHAGLIATPTGGASALKLTITTGTTTATRTVQFDQQIGSDHVLVRTDKAIYEVGETLSVDVFVSGASRHAYVDWLNEGQVIDMRTVDIDGGKATFTMDVDGSLLGDNRIEAYVVDTDGNVVRASKTLFVKTSSALSVSFDTDKPIYEPGEPAKLTFTVKDEDGKPKVAALGVQIVDEAVFALIDAKPGLLQTFFEIEDAVSKPQYEIHGASWNVPELIFGGAGSDDDAKAEAAQTQAGAAFAAMTVPGTSGIRKASWAKIVTDARDVLIPYFDKEKTALSAIYAAAAKKAIADLESEGCTSNDWYCQGLGMDYMQAVVERTITLGAAYDFWGNAWAAERDWGWETPLRLITLGPDEVKGTADDWSTLLTYKDLGIPDEIRQKHTPQAGGMDDGDWNAGADGGAGGGGGGWGPPEAGEEPTTSEGGDEPLKVRDDFPETLYVNPALITGPDGTATVDLEMADSITEWRVSTMAHSADGRLGAGVFGVTVFQDFFVDINFPAQLTRGDEVTFPIAVYNFLAEPQSVTITLEGGSWFTALGATSATLDLAPSQVTVAKFPVRVETVGVHKLTVKGIGTKKQDAVARVVRVVPDGKAFPASVSGALPPGEVTHTVSFPAGAVPGSEALHVTIYPAFLSQVVEGLDSMLQVPYGCFEQTTSTTWPNVLVTTYMEETGQVTPEIQLKAESYISQGYQRLLTYEHPGGGFSWFGTQDPAPFLTVTALGVMEFSDMRAVFPVDEAMLARTQSWLAAQQKPDGSWPGDISEFFSFQSSTIRNSAFVVWALGTSGFTGAELAKGVGYLKTGLKGDEDAYTLATVANALAVSTPGDPLLSELLSKLDAMKKVDGDKVYWDTGDAQTVFYGYGDSAAVETTAVVAHAMLVAGGYKATVDGAITYLLSKKDAQGNFGPTSATVWTLRTLLTAAKIGSEGAVGAVTISLDGKKVKDVMLTADQWDVMSTVDLAAYATTGDHTVTLAFAGTGKVSYNVVSSHHLPWADVSGDPEGPLAISVAYDKTSLQVNDTVQATVTVKNLTAATLSMVLVTVGLPPGFQVVDEDLEAYKADGLLSKFEKTGKQLTLYMFELPAMADQAYTYRLLATMPVKAADGGAAAYPYYEPDEKSVAESQLIEVTD